MAPSKDLTDEEMEQFDWISLRRDMDTVVPTETQGQKFMRKFKENPFVPIGGTATAMALLYGLWSFKTGQKRMSQYMMRTRIAAQGFTVVAMIVGVSLTARKSFQEKEH